MQICDKSACTGCGACANICPVKCIKMEYDFEGYIYPNINEQACINCGACNRVCPQLAEGVGSERNGAKIAYQALSKDESVLLRSTSGGMFSELARVILEDGGVVFGAYFDVTDMSVHHSYIENYEYIDRFNGSKYIGSNVHCCFEEAKSFLKQGRKVLFSGTPCQIDGLRSYLSKDYDNLYTVDFVCFGIGSQKVLRLFTEELEKQNNGKIISLKFRDKPNGYVRTSFCADLKCDDGEKQVVYPSYGNLFGKLFADGKIIRESCYSCKYASIERVTDITLADCVKDIDEYQRKFGCSLLMVNTDKGNELFKQILDRISLKEISVEQAKQMQPRFSSPLKMPECRKALMKDLKKSSIAVLRKKYFTSKTSIVHRAARKLKSIVSKAIKRG